MSSCHHRQQVWAFLLMPWCTVHMQTHRHMHPCNICSKTPIASTNQFSRAPKDHICFFTLFFLFFYSHCCHGLFVTEAWCEEDKNNNAWGNPSASEQFMRSFLKMCMRYFDKGQYKLFGLFSINMHPYSSVNRWQLCLAHKEARCIFKE